MSDPTINANGKYRYIPINDSYVVPAPGQPSTGIVQGAHFKPDPNNPAFGTYTTTTFGGGDTGPMVNSHYGAAPPGFVNAPAAPQPQQQPTQPAAAVPPTGNIYGNTPDAWANFLQQARAQTEGLNRMPYVFSDYGSIPTDPTAANALFYPDNLQTAKITNPLLTIQDSKKK